MQPATKPPAPRHLVIDTDGGIDDAFALWWALDRARVGELTLLAITTVHGNVDVDVATGNVCKVLHAQGTPDVRVACGADDPCGPVPALRRADFIHGTDGLGDGGLPDAPFGACDASAVDVLREVVDADPGAVTVVTLGPLTNIAEVLRADPSWAQRVGRLVVMGGVVAGPGNAQPFAEANVAHDPTAASIVVAADWAVPPLLVGLDATHRATLGPAELDVLDERATPAAAFLAGPMAVYRRFGGTFCEPGEIPCHDLLATMAAVDPDVVATRLLPLAVVTAPGPAWGATIADRRVPFFERADPGAVQACPDGFRSWAVAVDGDAARFRAAVTRWLLPR